VRRGTNREMSFQEFLWQFLLLAATALFGVLAEWARRMLPDPKRDDEDKPRKLRRVKAPSDESEDEQGNDDGT
jgi:hypothetical protein